MKTITGQVTIDGHIYMDYTVCFNAGGALVFMAREKISAGT